MAVDPANTNIVYVGSPSGLSKTADGGATWGAVSGGWSAPTVPSSGVAIAFDPASSAVGNVTQKFYVCVYGSGVWVTTNAGSSFTSLVSGGPTTFNQMIVDQNSVLWVVDYSGDLWRYNGSWTKVITHDGSFYAVTVAVNPLDASNVVCGAAGLLKISFDSGASFTLAGTGASQSYQRFASDIPWLAWTNHGPDNGFQMDAGNLVFDLVNANRLIFTSGIGVWSNNPPTTNVANTRIDWTSMTLGIENLDCNQIKKPRDSGKLAVAAWDRAVFMVDTVNFPATHGLVQFPPGNNLQSCWSLDCVDANTIVCLADDLAGNYRSGKSVDAGKTWSVFGSQSPGIALGGNMVAVDATHYVWVPGYTGSTPGASGPFYTTDGGITWTLASVSSSAGWGSNYYEDRQMLCVDRVAGHIYAYNNANTAADPSGIWRSTDKGQTWTLLYVDHGGANIQFKAGALADLAATLREVPSQAGHLFFSVGTQGTNSHPQNTPFLRTTDASTTWQDVSNGSFTIKEVWAFAFGKSASGKTYPAVYIVGWVNSVFGFWMSIDNCATWQKIGDGYPAGSMSAIKQIEADPDIFGRVFIATGGNGCYMGTFA
jgi:hypothetical protein